MLTPLSEDEVMLFLALELEGCTVDEIAEAAASWVTMRRYMWRRPAVALRLLGLRFGRFQSMHTTAREILYANSMMRPCPVQIPPAPGIATCTVTREGRRQLRTRGLAV